MNSSQLAEAKLIYDNYPAMSKKSKRSALERLAAFGFSSRHLSKITGMSWTHANKYTRKLGPETKFSPKTLDALTKLQLRWEQTGEVSGVLARNIIMWGTSITGIVQLTEIPLETLREAVHEQQAVSG